MKGLDRWITGNYGEDQFRDSKEEAREEALADDEGMQILVSARGYLETQAPADYDDSPCDLIDECRRLIERDYECRFCGKPLPKTNSYCSAKCAKADAEGL